jgi:uncharacterized cupredoxin-like copper-binding protein
VKRLVVLALLAAAVAGCGGGGPSERTVAVRMHYSRYMPHVLTVRAGTTVDFRLVNTDPIAHEFIIGTHVEQLAHERGDPHDPHKRPGEAAIAGSQTTHIRYTFRTPGTLEFACHRPGHYAYGMVGTIVVES